MSAHTQFKPAVRLTRDQVRVIRAAVAEFFGPRAAVWVFGSRADPTRRGGDIDLYIETPHGAEAALDEAGRLYAYLQGALGEQRMDIVTRTPDQPEAPIHRVARETGVRL